MSRPEWLTALAGGVGGMKGGVDFLGSESAREKAGAT